VKKGAAAFVGCGGPRLRVAVVDDVGDDGAHARHGGASIWARWPRGRSGTAAMAFGGRIWEEKRRRGERGEEGRVSEAARGNAWALPLSSRASVGVEVSPNGRSSSRRPWSRRHGDGEQVRGLGSATVALGPQVPRGNSLLFLLLFK
jgi:hypothetical protein